MLFRSECKRRYSVKLWRIFADCFNCMPVAAVVEDKILCMHGGLSPDLDNLSQIFDIPRPTDVPDEGLLCDLLWADPDSDVMGWGYNSRLDFVSYCFHDYCLPVEFDTNYCIFFLFLIDRRNVVRLFYTGVSHIHLVTTLYRIF